MDVRGFKARFSPGGQNMEIVIIILIMLVCIISGIKKVLFPEGAASKAIPCLLAVAIGGFFINILLPNAIFIKIAKLCVIIIILLLVFNVIRHNLDF